MESKFRERQSAKMVRITITVTTAVFLFLYGRDELTNTLSEGAGTAHVGLFVVVYNVLVLMLCTAPWWCPKAGRAKWLYGVLCGMTSVAGISFWMTCRYGPSCYTVTSPLFFMVLLYVHVVTLLVVVPILLFILVFVGTYLGMTMCRRLHTE